MLGEIYVLFIYFLWMMDDGLKNKERLG